MAHTVLPGEFIPCTARGVWVRAAQALDQIRCRLPGACPLCGQRTAGSNLCVACHYFVTGSMHGSVPRCTRCCLVLNDGRCADCSRQHMAFDRVLAAFDYTDPGDLLVRQFKLQCRFGLAPLLARLLSATLDQAAVSLPAPDLVVPVPSYPSAVRRRGFSPAAQLTSYVCHLRGWRADYRLLGRRSGAGPSQKTLTRSQRAQQALAMYHCTRSIAGRTVLVIDDVMTTGSTLNAVATALRQAGAVSVNGLVLARTPARHAP